ncbi:MAG: hypothetical protein V2I33_23415, partial [Kangiellaceae bacterium]|nr:hypothetical protein [Kangiellaceae bacterium]
MPVHFVLPPKAFICASVRPLVDSIAFDVVVFELADEVGAICPAKGATAVFLSIMILSLIARAVRPEFLATPF